MSALPTMRVRISGATSATTTNTAGAGGGTHKEASQELEIEMEVPAEDGLHPAELLRLAFLELDSRLPGLNPQTPNSEKSR